MHSLDAGSISVARKGHLAKQEQGERRNQEIIREIVIIKCEEEVTWEVGANQLRRKRP